MKHNAGTEFRVDEDAKETPHSVSRRQVETGPWILRHIPPHRIYVEPFGGGGSVLLQKPRSYAEVYNDMDGEMVNLFKVARDHGEQLAQALELTPFARVEFVGAYEPTGDPLEQARRTLVRSFMGFGSAGASGHSTGFRANSNRSGTTPARDWMNYPEHLRVVIQRLRGVVVENRDAAEVMRTHDGDEAVHYVDPPYVHETRSLRNSSPAYRHEMTNAQHEELALVCGICEPRFNTATLKAHRKPSTR